MHTKGPWTIKWKCNVFSERRLVANCGGYRSNIEDVDPENEANARLIAEAPTLKEDNVKLSQAVNDKDQELFESQELVGELLEALEELCRVNELHDVLEKHEFINAYNQSREAIRKAKEKL